MLKTTKFIAKLLLLLLIVSILLLVIVDIITPLSYNYSLVDKTKRIDSITVPQIILVGGSDVAFGFDSKLIEDAFDMPVTNFGIHAGLGQKFHAEAIKEYIKEGDIIILAPCVYTQNENYVLEWQTVENRFDKLTDFGQEDYLGHLNAYPAFLRSVLNVGITYVVGAILQHEVLYKRSNFNEYGDFALPRVGTIISEYDKSELDDKIDPEMIDYWNSYYLYVKERGAHLYFSAPPILSNGLTVDVDELNKQLSNILEVPVISDFSDYVYPIELFYNTTLHLNDEGARIRTEQFISDLSAVVNN